METLVVILLLQVKGHLAVVVLVALALMAVLKEIKELVVQDDHLPIFQDQFFLLCLLLGNPL